MDLTQQLNAKPAFCASWFSALYAHGTAVSIAMPCWGSAFEALDATQGCRLPRGVGTCGSSLYDSRTLRHRLMSLSVDRALGIAKGVPASSLVRCFVGLVNGIGSKLVGLDRQAKLICVYRGSLRRFDYFSIGILWPWNRISKGSEKDHTNANDCSCRMTNRLVIEPNE